MCGIAGYLGGTASPGANPEAVLVDMGLALRHRGPDDAGAWWDSEGEVGLSHRRLSIQDLSPLGRQPMSSANGRWITVFNGEIYNFRELRRRLAQQGVVFRGESDTEVLLELVALEGPRKALGLCHGMFAVAFWDRQARRLFLARDRMGEKPLYYGWCGKTLLFGSELGALRRHPAWDRPLSREAIALYLKHNYVPAPLSIYAGIYKAAPATVLSFSNCEPGSVETEHYWNPATVFDEAVERAAAAEPAEVLLPSLDDLLRRVVGRQMIADVPLGAFLSGGVDSSLIAGIMQAVGTRPAQTFTIGFGEREFNEAHHAKAVADVLGTDHTEFVLTPDEARDVIPELPSIYSEPFADSSQIPTLLLARLARSAVTVALSGDGGDELFGGYTRYPDRLQRWNRQKAVPLPLRSAAGYWLRKVPDRVLDRAVAGAAWCLPRGFAERDLVTKLKSRGYRWGYASMPEAYTRSVSYWAEPDKLARSAGLARTVDDTLAGMQAVESDPLRWMMYRDSQTYLPDDILTKVDRAAMSVSLETRVPLLDHSVVEFAWAVPTALHYGDGRGKYLLRKLLERYLPPALIDRPKQGFAVPLADWLRGPLRGWAGDLLDGARLRREGWLDDRPIQRRWRAFLAGEEGHALALWGVLMFEAWLDQADR